MQVTRVLLVGGGRTHLEALRTLRRRRPSVEITLASPEAQPLHTPMLAGVVAGRHSSTEARLDLSGYAHSAGVRFVPDAVASVDLYTRIATLESGEFVPFDVLSLDTGAVPDRALVQEGHAIAVRPVRAFLAAWDQLRAEVARGEINTLTVVGGDADDLALLFAMHHALASEHPEELPRFALVTDRAELLPGHPREARRRIGRALVARQIVIHLASAVAAVEARSIVTADRRRIASDRIVLAARRRAPAWFGDSGLVCDNAGFPRVNEHLQSISHPFVFASPGCAIPDTAPAAAAHSLSRSASRALARNLGRFAAGQALARHHPRAWRFAVIPTGDGRAIVSAPPFVAEGDWVSRWKESHDRRFVARFQAPSAAGTAEIDAERLS